jgi:polyhydroxybutyrate depolymerase
VGIVASSDRLFLAGIAWLLATAGAQAACPEEPVANCRLASTHRASYAHGGSESDRFRWSWVGGPPTTLADLGDPRLDAAYSLCVYAGSQRIATIEVAAASTCDGSPCWSEIKGKGYRYRDGSGAAGGVNKILLKSDTKGRAKIRLAGRGPQLPELVLPVGQALTVQMSQSTGPACFESVFGSQAIAGDLASGFDARERIDAATALPALPSAGCDSALGPYAPGVSTAASLDMDGLSRTFLVHLPPSFPVANDRPTAVLLLLHGGFGSGAQIEQSSRMLEVSATEGFIVVSPDGVAGPFGARTWNAGECCGFAQTEAVDDVGFVSALIDHLGSELCIDRRRVYAAGMSNGAMLAHRLACDLAPRIRAIGAVAAPNATSVCEPSRPVPVVHIHGTADQHAPYAGGLGCGLSGYAFDSVLRSIEDWRARNACEDAAGATELVGDAVCETTNRCAPGTAVRLCSIAGGGHQWPGGLPPGVTGTPDCAFGYQSPSYFASGEIWSFFAEHPPR